MPDTFKVAKTVLHQGSLMPLSNIVQPVMWSFADCLHLYPHPDMIVLADECVEDYHYKVPVNGHKSTFHDISFIGNEDNSDMKTVTILNPGNFGYDKSFTVLYPLNED